MIVCNQTSLRTEEALTSPFFRVKPISECIEGKVFQNPYKRRIGHGVGHQKSTSYIFWHLQQQKITTETYVKLSKKLPCDTNDSGQFD